MMLWSTTWRLDACGECGSEDVDLLSEKEWWVNKGNKWVLLAGCHECDHRELVASRLPIRILQMATSHFKNYERKIPKWLGEYMDPDSETSMKLYGAMTHQG